MNAVSDFTAIRALLQQYCDAIDANDYERLRNLFTFDARLQYALGPEPAPLRTAEEMLERLSHFNTQFVSMKHELGEAEVAVDGDTGRSRVALRASHQQRDSDGRRNFWVVYGVYEDTHVRTSLGWRICSRSFRCERTEGALWSQASF